MVSGKLRVPSSSGTQSVPDTLQRLGLGVAVDRLDANLGEIGVGDRETRLQHRFNLADQSGGVQAVFLHQIGPARPVDKRVA